MQDSQKKEALEKDDAIFQHNFLDDLKEDQPHGCWALQKDMTHSIAILRNRSWPGYVAYHKANTKTFGSIYIGEGIKNAELPFMI